MIYRHIGTGCRYGDQEYRVGDNVVATAGTPWEGLYGTITEIRDGDDSKTAIGTLNLYCEFLPPIHPDEISKVEKRFSTACGSEKHIEDVALTMVILSPEMVRIIGRKDEQRMITVYLVREEWVFDYNSGIQTYLFADQDEARMAMMRMIHEDMVDGCISRWRGRGDLDAEIKEDAYEYWLHDSYHENHYLVTISSHKLFLSRTSFQHLGSLYVDQCRINDFVSHIEGWEELEDLTEDEYLKFIADPEIADRIMANLSENDSYCESYWESISECAFQLLREYRNTLQKPDCFSQAQNIVF